MEDLKLAHAKPLVFIKIQTTGLRPKEDRIIELSLTKIDTDGKKTGGTRYVNPEIEIPEEATKVNGITNEMVKNEPTFKAIAEKISKFIEGCDFVGFNISHFDLKFLSEEFNRANVEFMLMGKKVVDIADIYQAMEPRDFSAAASFYCQKPRFTTIASQAATELYAEILNSMMTKYQDTEFVDKNGVTNKIEATVESIDLLFNKNRKKLDISGFLSLNDENRAIFSEGKHKNKLIADVLLTDPDGRSYCDWVINVSNFAADTKLVLKKIVAKIEASTVAK